MLNGEGEKEKKEGLEKEKKKESAWGRREGEREREMGRKRILLFSCTTYFLTPKYPPAQTCVPKSLLDISTFILNSTCSQDI